MIIHYYEYSYLYGQTAMKTMRMTQKAVESEVETWTSGNDDAKVNNGQLMRSCLGGAG